ncbi:unnamed protein product [Cylindrotheca closterium]|uniref:ER lumen protein-retaining receptor n=1 Tax=Cylindrotheca closterium TaxID=2856 RepID=A0AAD2JH09_9STRA|nr:unnamed protein product [Cylindrotheca closterium]
MAHLVAVLMLLKMAKRGNASVISLKAQELYLVVYLARYLDVFTTWYSLYNTAMKIFYIFATALIVCTLRSGESWHTSYSPSHDSFRHWKFLAIPVFFLASVVHLYGSQLAGFSFMEMLWTYSICLEAVAMWPQLVMFKDDTILKENQGDLKAEILWPIFLFGIYRAFYILSWIYRANTDTRGYRHHPLTYICAVIQVLLYSSFFKKFCRDALAKRNRREPTGEESDLKTPLVTNGERNDNEMVDLELSESSKNADA